MSNALGRHSTPFCLSITKKSCEPWHSKIKEDPEALIDMLLTTIVQNATYEMKATIFDKTTA